MDDQRIVIDNSSQTLRIGIGGDEVPGNILHSAVESSDSKRWEYPLARSLHYADPECLIPVWKRLLDLNPDYQPAQHHIVLINPMLTSETINNKCAEIWFEEFNSTGLILTQSTTAACYWTGTTTLVMLEAGHSYCGAHSIFEGFDIKDSRRILMFGGKDLTEDYMQAEEEHKLAEQQAGAELFDERFDGPLYHHFVLPDGQETGIPMPFAKNYCRGLFSRDENAQLPKCFQQDNFSVTLSELVLRSVESVHFSARKRIFNKVSVIGGLVKLPGFKTQLEHSLKALVSESFTVKIVEILGQSVWGGGSVIASLNSSNDIVCSKSDYYEYGNYHRVRP